MADQLVPPPATEDKDCGVGDCDSGGSGDRDRWYYSRKEIEENSPSRRDGISLKEENDFRKTYGLFIFQTGKKFKIKLIISATATVFCHRFFLRRSHAKHDKHRIAIACLFLASKVLESPLSFVRLSEEGWKETLKTVFKEEISSLEEQIQIIIRDEKVVLEAINFDFDVELPYKYLAEVGKKTNLAKNTVDVVLGYINDAFFKSHLSLQFKPQKVVGAAFYLAYKLLKLDVPFQSENGWQEFFLVTPNELEDISNQILDLFEQRTPPVPVPVPEPDPVPDPVPDPDPVPELYPVPVPVPGEPSTVAE